MEVQRHDTFPKEERLCGKTGISMLLAGGRHGRVPGLRFTFRRNTGKGCCRILVSVPKKLFRRAVKRNLLKRRIRESWRRQKHNVAEGNGMDILLAYSVKEVMSYGEIFLAVAQVIEKINERAAGETLTETTTHKICNEKDSNSFG